MKIRIKKVPQQVELNARKWKHGDGGNLFLDGGTQASDNTRVQLGIVPNLPMDNSAESKFYRDLALLSAMSEEERKVNEFRDRATNQGAYQHTVSPTDIQARTGWMEINPISGEAEWHTHTTVSATPLTEGQRMWRSPAFQLALAPMFDAPFMLRGINQIKYSPNAFREAIIKDAKQYGKKLNDSWWDYNYENAVKNNDNILIDNLEKERFRVKAPKNKAVDVNKRPQITYHTVSDNFDPNFNIFDTNIEGRPTAIYTTDSPEMSLSYSKSRDLNRMKRLYVNLDNPVEIDNAGNPWNTISLSRLPQDVSDKIRPADFWGHYYTTRSLEEAQRGLWYDGSIIKNVKDYGSKVEDYIPHTVYMINKPSNVKLVGPTLDNSGNLIPLSKRFDFTNPDMRYAVPFTIGLGTTGYNYLNQNQGPLVEMAMGGKLFGEGGQEQNELSTGNIGFFNHPLLSLKYYGSPLYDLETPFTIAFTDAIIKGKDNFMWGDKVYSTDIDWNKKFERDANGNIPFKEFANYIYPAVVKVLKEKGLPLTNAHNIVRLAGLESQYGTNPVSGKGYNLSGIKWNSKTMGNYNHATNSKDNLEYVDFDNLKDYLEFKIDLLNNRYDAINAENDKDFVDRLHLKSSGINKKGFDYSTNYKGYLNMLLNTKSLDKWLKLLYTPVVTQQGNL